MGLSLCGCAAQASTAAPRKSHPDAKSAITLPVIVDMTGADASFGQGQIHGMDYVLGSLNKSGGIGGHRISLNICDTQSTVTGASACGQKFTNDRVVVTASVIANIEAALPYLKSSLVLASTNLLNPNHSSNAFQVAPSGAEVDTIVDQVAKASGFTKVGIIASDDSVGESQLKFIKTDSKGLNLDIQLVSDSSTDDSVPMESLLSQHVQMIYAAALGGAGSAIIQAYKVLSPSVPLVVTGADSSISFLKAIASNEPANGFYAIPGTPLVPNNVPPAYRSRMKSFIKGFSKEFSETPDSIAISGTYAVDVAIGLLQGVGLKASLRTSERWLHSHTIDALTNVQFSSKTLNVLSGVPAGFVRVLGTKFVAAKLKI